MRVHRKCCGLDVHKKMIAACLLTEDAEGNSVVEKRLFGTMTRELHELAQWLCAGQVTAVAMENGAGHQTSLGLDPGRRSWSHGRSLSFCGRHGELGRHVSRQQPNRRETEERHHARG